MTFLLTPNLALRGVDFEIVGTLLDIFVSRNAATLATNRLSTSIGAKRGELCSVAWKMSGSVGLWA
jgi:hypothetical protein